MKKIGVLFTTVNVILFAVSCFAYKGEPYVDFQEISVGHIQAFLDEFDGDLKNTELSKGFDLDESNYSAETTSTWNYTELKSYPDGSSAAKFMSPAEIIYFAAKENSINPVLLLAKIQDESSLIAQSLETRSEQLKVDKQYILNRIVGYGVNTGIKKYKSFLAQLVGCTYQFNEYKNNDKSIEEAYTTYTQTNTFENFDTKIYSDYRETMNRIIKDFPLCYKFTDVSKKETECTALQYLNTNGIIEGYPDNTFQSYRLINRAELVKILLIKDIPDAPNCVEGDSPFLDVKYGEWYCDSIKYAKERNYVDGYLNGEFKPGALINRAEVTKIIYTYWNGKPLTEADNWYLSYFNGKMAKCDNKVFGEDLPYPSAYVKRGEAARLMYCMINDEK